MSAVSLGRRMKRPAAIVAILAAVIGIAAACSPNTGSTTSAQCGFIVGDGTHDRKIHKIVYPNEVARPSDTEDNLFVPCGPRNFIINDGSVKNPANHNQQVGDRFTVTHAYTKATTSHPSIELDIWSHADWTLNESQDALKVFYPLCDKYKCYTTSASDAGNANFSTPGWNGMLSENFGPHVDTSFKTEVSQSFDSSIVQNPSEWQSLANAVSGEFRKEVRAPLGTNQDIFCGASSKFIDSNHKDFNCTNVYFSIDLIQPTDPVIRNLFNQTAEIDAQNALNAKRIANAKELYGPRWPEVLGGIDQIKACNQSTHVTCVVNVNGATSNVSVNTGK